jgi:type IV pilus assembly protein PilA
MAQPLLTENSGCDPKSHQPHNGVFMKKLIKKKGFTLVELMIVVAIIGILAAIAIPNFIKFQARSKQSEPKANLKALFTAQRAYFSEKDSYNSTVGDIGFNPERGNRYFLATGCATLTQRTVAQESSTTGDCGFAVDVFKGYLAITTGSIANATESAATAGAGTCGLATTGCVVLGNTGAFAGIAAGNVDNDSVIDNWLVSSMSMVIAASALSEQQNNGPGVPANNINDVR